MKKIILTIGAVALLLSGCATQVPTGQRTTTTSDVDKSGRVIKQTVVEETNVSPDAISQAASDMVQACYDSFSAEYDIKDKYVAKLESEDLKTLLIFREFRVGIQQSNGYNPRDVCKNPETIYTYAKASNLALYNTISKISGDVTGMAKDMTPFISLWQLGKAGINKAGDTFGDHGTKETFSAGRDQVAKSDGVDFSGTEEVNENHQSGVTDSTLNADKPANAAAASEGEGEGVGTDGLLRNDEWTVVDGKQISVESAKAEGLL